MAPGADFSTAVVQWAMADAAKPRVRWSLSPLLLSSSTSRSSRTRDEKGGGRNGSGNATANSTVFEVEGQTSTYTREQMCGGSANSSGWFEPGNLHRATLRASPPRPACSTRCLTGTTRRKQVKPQTMPNRRRCGASGHFSPPRLLLRPEREKEGTRRLE